jgi:tetratricopeptide (TPR) repeat protein
MDCAAVQFDSPPAAIGVRGKADRFNYYLNAAAILVVLGRNAEAQQQLDLAENIFAESSDLHFVKGFELLNSGAVTDAEQQFRQSLAIEPSDETSRALALAYRRQGDFLNASNVLTQAVELSSQPFALYLDLGFVQLDLGLPQQALTSFDQARKQSPFAGEDESGALGTQLNARLAEGYGEAWRKLAEEDEARGLRTEAEYARQQADSAEREQAWWNLADGYETRGLQAEALDARRQAVAAAASRRAQSLTK